MLILKENTFIFAGEHYRQITGIAMGTPVAPTLANLFMGKVEHEALSAWGGTQPLVWLRYIDDILVIMEDSQETLLELVKHLNARISSIKYTTEISDKSIDFLDFTIFKTLDTNKESSTFNHTLKQVIPTPISTILLPTNHPSNLVWSGQNLLEH